MEIKNITYLKCEKCGHIWNPTKEVVSTCAKCKSPKYIRLATRKEIKNFKSGGTKNVRDKKTKM